MSQISTGPSTLQRLFTFAKAERVEALENFTTEALAAAIRADPAPLIEALRNVVVDPLPEPLVLRRVETQVFVPGGTVDLSVEFDTCVFWFEVKAHSGISGGQLAVYTAALAVAGYGVAPKLMLLAKRALAADLHTLQWNHLRAAIPAGAHPYWTDLRRFLEEHGMANANDEQIIAGEVAALGEAHRLLGKMDRIAETFIAGFVPPNDADPEFPKTDTTRRRDIGTQFQKFGRAVVSSWRYPCICFGVTRELDGPQFRLWIETRAKDFAARETIFALARAHGLHATWEIDPTASGDFGIGMDARGGLEHDVALEWLRARMAELHESKILAALPQFRKNAPPVPPTETGVEGS